MGEIYPNRTLKKELSERFGAPTNPHCQRKGLLIHSTSPFVQSIIMLVAWRRNLDWKRHRLAMLRPIMSLSKIFLLTTSQTTPAGDVVEKSAKYMISQSSM